MNGSRPYTTPNNLATGMDNVTIGFDAAGLEKYIENLRLNILEEVIKTIDNGWDPVNEAINDAWTGASKDAFVNDFAKTIGEVKEHLTYEFAEIESRLRDIQTFYFNQDQNMMSK